MVKTDLVLTSEQEKIEEKLDNSECTVDTLIAIIDYPYTNEIIKYRIYKKIIAHRNSTEEVYRYIIGLVGDSFQHMLEIYTVIAEHTTEESTLQAILNCKYANNTYFFSSIALPILKNSNVTEDIIFNMLVDCFIFHNDTLFYYIDYPAFLSIVIRKTKRKKNLELAISLAIQNNICNNLEIFSTLFNLNKKISDELFIKALKVVLEESNKLISQLASCESLEQKSLYLSKNSNISDLLFLFANSNYTISINELNKIINFAIATNNEKLATVLAGRSDCVSNILEKLLFFKESEDCMSSLLHNANRTESMLSVLAVPECSNITDELLD